MMMMLLCAVRSPEANRIILCTPKWAAMMEEKRASRRAGRLGSVRFVDGIAAFSNAIPGAPRYAIATRSDPNYAGTIRRKIKQHLWLSITDTRMIDSSLNDIRTER
jgi:hypothetical protein